MQYTGPIYRPPFEADSLLLQVTAGCSHNQCSFCVMYKDVSFQVSKMDQIERDILEARMMYQKIPRIFLVNGDAFVLSASKLKKVATKINEIIPEAETIAMYASINNIAGKTDEELRELRALKINDLNIGLESGMEEVVEHFNKGFAVAEAKKQLARLRNAGMDYGINIILGGAGSEKSKEHAIVNSKLLNETKPAIIFIATLHIEPGCRLHGELMEGLFRENTIRQNIEEEIELLRGLELEDTYFFGLHNSNPIPVHGMLPEDKNGLIAVLQSYLNRIRPEILDAPRPIKS